MKKGIFLVFHGFTGYNGISKKISYQIDAFRQCGIDMKLCFYDVLENGERVWKLEDKIVYSFGKGTLAKIKRRIDYSGVTKAVISTGADFIYIRSMHNANPFTIKMVKDLKKAGIKILMEIPTYPYDQEYIYWKMKPELYIDKCFRKKLSSHIDRIVTFSDYETIFGCPTIRISNGVDFSQIPLKQNINDTSSELNLIAVAEIHYWHGFDRIIRGLAEYYRHSPEYQVYLHLVGSFFGSREQEEIMIPIAENHLENHITLYGNRQDSGLDILFEKADLGIGSLARHRCGITNIKTLKNREYAARGIPFIYSETDTDFEEMPYILKVPADESPINIPSLIDFYRKCEKDPGSIRNSVVNTLSWKAQVEKVLNSI